MTADSPSSHTAPPSPAVPSQASDPATVPLTPEQRAQWKAERAQWRADRAVRRARTERRRNAVFKAARSLIRWLPLPVASALGEVFGRLVYLTVPWIRRQALRNLEWAWGAEKTPAERRRIARRCFGLTGRAFFAWIVHHRMGAERALTYVTKESCPEADALFASGRGLIFLAPHSGLIELAGGWGAKHLDAIALSRDGRDAGISLVMEMRKEFGFRTIQTNHPRELVRALRGGGRVVMLIDQDYRHVRGAYVPFFGRPTHTPTGLASLAVRLKLPVVPVTAEWKSFTRHNIRFDEPIYAREDLPQTEAILELTARCTAAIERSVRRRPEEWFWFHERWRTSPADRPWAPVYTPGAAGAPGTTLRTPRPRKDP